MIITILGRQPAIGVTELERVHGSSAVSWFSAISALVKTDNFDVQRYGSIVKAGRVVAELPRGDWRTTSMKLTRAYEQVWGDFDGKLTLGISAYGFDRTSARDVQKTGLVLKQKLKKKDVSLRLIPNTEPALSSATAHHNKLGLSDNKVELLVIRSKNGKVIIAESLGTQNITALAARDQGRPKRDAFVGMLPPKLALTMVNLSGINALLAGSARATPAAAAATSFSEDSTFPAAESQERQLHQLATSGPEEKDAVGDGSDRKKTLLDPFCGTGVILQEAALLGNSVYGTDLSEKMIRYSRDNLNWLEESHRLKVDWYLHEGDATTATWRSPVDAVATETYLGQPFSAPPSPAKLKEVRGNCNHIISTFLKNIAGQIDPGTQLCVAVPAWRDVRGRFTHLPLIEDLGTLGFERIQLTNVQNADLLYFREDQVVARELLLLTRK